MSESPCYFHSSNQYTKFHIQQYIRSRMTPASADTHPYAHLHSQVHHHRTLSPMTPTLTMDVPSTRLMPTHYSPPKVPPVNYSPQPQRVRFVTASSSAAPAFSPSRSRRSSGHAITHYGSRTSSRARTTSRSRRGSRRSPSPRRHGGNMPAITCHIVA